MSQSLSRAGLFAQIIQVLDDTAPELIEGPELEIYSANQFECSGDITLKEVLRVVTNRYPEGHNEVRFNAKDLDATGVLYYRLEFEGKAAVKKMIVME